MPSDSTSEPVFVIATQRSGTNYLRSLLRGTGHFADFDEILHSEIDKENPAPFAYFDWAEHSYFTFRVGVFESRPELSIPHPRNVKQLFNEYLDYLASKADHRRYFLMDVKYNSLHHFDPVWQSLTDPKYVLQLIKQRGAHVVHLVRENVFDTYLSCQVANATGTYVKSEGYKLQDLRVHVDISKMFAMMERIEREINLMRHDLRSLPNVFELTYESICGGQNGSHEAVMSGLSEFFSVELKIQNPPRTQKIIKDRWAAIENATEVKRALQASSYAYCIDSAAPTGDVFQMLSISRHFYPKFSDALSSNPASLKSKLKRYLYANPRPVRFLFGNRLVRVLAGVLYKLSRLP